MKISRRNFVGSISSLILAGGTLSNFKVSAGTKKNLIVIMLRGGMDGLTAVPVLGDKNLKNSRPDISVENLKPLNSEFSLHPQLSTFHALWKKEKAAIEKKVDNLFHSGIEWYPLHQIDLKEDQYKSAINLLKALYEDEDVQNVYTNLKEKKLH